MFQLTPINEMRRIFETNFFGTLFLTQLATRWMARKRQGAVVNIASVAGHQRRQQAGLFRQQGRDDFRHQNHGTGIGRCGHPRKTPSPPATPIPI